MKTSEVTTKTKWSIDPSHSEISFKIKHLGITNIKGLFTEFDANIYTTGDDFLTSEIDFWINPESVDTRDEKRDAHLKGGDFFDVRNHKQISFVGDSIEKMDRVNNFVLYGNLSIKGITHKIKMDAEFGGIMKDPWGNEKAGLKIKGKINRKEWGLNWNTTLEAGGFLVSDQVSITCEIELTKLP